MQRTSLTIAIFILASIVSLDAWAFEAATPTAQEAARCATGGAFEQLCLSSYSVAPLKFPTEATTFGALSPTGKMAIYTPDGPGPFPALIIMHTCGAIEPEHTAYWVKSAIANGYAAFILDSWSQRGVKEECGGIPLGFNAAATRTRDGYDALAHLTTIPAIDAEHVAAIGFSHGGRVAYMMASPGLAKIYSPDGRRFAALVSAYGECYNRPTKFAYLRPTVGTPLLALLGDKDEDGDIRECEPRLQALKAAGAPVEWHIYPGIGHSWDQPNLRVPFMRAYNGALSGRVLMKYDAGVTDDSRDRAFAFINAQMKK